MSIMLHFQLNDFLNIWKQVEEKLPLEWYFKRILKVAVPKELLGNTPRCQYFLRLEKEITLQIRHDCSTSS